jgi:hypothetical protein
MEAIFNIEEASIICGQPICPNSQADKLVWGVAKKGRFIVRSAYHVAKEIVDHYMGGSSEEMSKMSIWKRIWRVGGPIKLFMWQAYINILPPYENLF